MAQFVLEGIGEAAREETPFVLGFIEALFFTENGDTSMDDWDATPEEERESDGCLPSDAGYHDLAPEARASIRKMCDAWQAANAEALSRAYALGYSADQAGRDLWFTGQGHGVGFWDRGLGDIGQDLSDACEGVALDPYFDGELVHL